MKNVLTSVIKRVKNEEDSILEKTKNVHDCISNVCVCVYTHIHTHIYRHYGRILNFAPRKPKEEILV